MICPSEARVRSTLLQATLIATLAGVLPASAAGVSVAFEIGQRDLVPEGIAFDPQSGAFFVSSTHRAKIVRVDEGGAVTDFIGEREHGFLGGVGLRVDAPRRLLWAASAMGTQTRGFSPEEKGRSTLFAFSLPEGAPVVRLSPDDDEDHLFNDVAITARGTVFVTDTLTHTVYRVGPARVLKRWLATDAIAYPNGLCLGPNDRDLYVAHDGGISVIDVASRSIERVQAPEGKRIDGIDGLYCVEGNLVAVQNHRGLERVARFELGARASVSEVVPLLEEHPRLHVPTTLTVVGGEGYLIANSYLDAFEADGSLWSLDRLADPVILRLPLRDEMPTETEGAEPSAIEEP